MRPNEVQKRIEDGFPGAATVQVQDLTGGGDHYAVVVVSDAFEGKRLLQRHQSVYACFKAELASGEVHALSVKAYTPEQWSTRSA